MCVCVCLGKDLQRQRHLGHWQASYDHRRKHFLWTQLLGKILWNKKKNGKLYLECWWSFERHIYISIFVPIPFYLDYFIFVISLKSKLLIPPNFYFFFKTDFITLSTLHFHMNFRTSLQISSKISDGLSIRFELNL